MAIAVKYALLLFAAIAMTQVSWNRASQGVALNDRLLPKLAGYAEARVAEFDQIPAERTVALRELAGWIREARAKGEEVQWIFICTHNSRRSQLAQVWAAAAAEFYGIDGVKCYSGGTESTAFNPRAVAALQHAGFEVESESDAAANPRYRVTSSTETEPLVCFSKRYDDPTNPQRGFIAIMTCSDAAESCPQVPGAARRLNLSYDDPKSADGTPDESAAYDTRCAQIARELLFTFAQVASANRVGN